MEDAEHSSTGRESRDFQRTKCDTECNLSRGEFVEEEMTFSPRCHLLPVHEGHDLSKENNKTAERTGTPFTGRLASCLGDVVLMALWSACQFDLSRL